MTSRQSLTLVVAAALACAAGGALAQSQQPAKPGEPGKDAPKKRQRVVSDLSGFELLDPAKLKDQPMVTGATRSLFGPKSPAPLAPNLTRLFGAAPVFEWEHAGRSKRFAFVLVDEAENERHRAEVEGLSYAWPSSAPKLQAGKTYYWSVKPLEPASAPASVSRGVIVVTDLERAGVDKALVTAAKAGDAYQAGLARAQVFTDRRLWYDAIGAYSELIARSPERAEAYEGRGTVYAQIPATRARADQDFARADELAKK